MIEQGNPGDGVDRNSPANPGDTGSIPGLGRFHTVFVQSLSHVRLFATPCTAAHQASLKRSNESILREISPEYSLEGLMLKLKLQYFGHLM